MRLNDQPSASCDDGNVGECQSCDSIDDGCANDVPRDKTSKTNHCHDFEIVSKHLLVSCLIDASRKSCHQLLVNYNSISSFNRGIKTSVFKLCLKCVANNSFASGSPCTRTIFSGIFPSVGCSHFVSFAVSP